LGTYVLDKVNVKQYNDSTMNDPKTLQDAVKFFSDYEQTHALMVEARWPNGIACPHCGTVEPTYMPKYRRFQCSQGCKKQFTLKTGTIFEDSPLPLEKWFTGMWLISNAKNGVSSCEVARAIGVTQKTAWYLLHRVRLIMQMGTFEKLRGPVEIDETFIGGLEKNKHEKKKKHAGTGSAGKEIVMGILERGKEQGSSRIRAKVVSNTDKPTLHGEIRSNVQEGSKVYTDAHRGYQGLSPDLEHAWVDHAVKYAEGQVHTNGCENFWSLFSRMLHGTYTHVDPQHLQAYVDEQAHRFNMRSLKDAERFKEVTKSVIGKRLMYKELITRSLETP
jgi:transposase-like protein